MDNFVEINKRVVTAFSKAGFLTAESTTDPHPGSETINLFPGYFDTSVENIADRFYCVYKLQPGDFSTEYGLQDRATMWELMWSVQIRPPKRGDSSLEGNILDLLFSKSLPVYKEVKKEFGSFSNVTLPRFDLDEQYGHLYLMNTVEFPND